MAGTTYEESDKAPTGDSAAGWRGEEGTEQCYVVETREVTRDSTHPALLISHASPPFAVIPQATMRT